MLFLQFQDDLHAFFSTFIVFVSNVRTLSRELFFLFEKNSFISCIHCSMRIYFCILIHLVLRCWICGFRCIRVEIHLLRSILGILCRCSLSLFRRIIFSSLIKLSLTFFADIRCLMFWRLYLRDLIFQPWRGKRIHELWVLGRRSWTQNLWPEECCLICWNEEELFYRILQGNVFHRCSDSQGSK